MTDAKVVARPLRLGDRLIQLGMITQDQLHIALMEQKAPLNPLAKRWWLWDS